MRWRWRNTRGFSNKCTWCFTKIIFGLSVWNLFQLIKEGLKQVLKTLLNLQSLLRNGNGRHPDMAPTRNLSIFGGGGGIYHVHTLDICGRPVSARVLRVAMALSPTSHNTSTATSLSSHHTMKPVGEMAVGEGQKVQKHDGKKAKDGPRKYRKGGVWMDQRKAKKKSNKETCAESIRK